MRLGLLVAALAMLVPMADVRSQACPQTLQSLVDNAPAGSTLLVPPCTFRETVNVSKPLTIDGQNKAVVDGEGKRIRWFWIASSDVTIKNFTMRNASTPSQVGAIATAAGIKNVVIDHNDLSGTTNGAPVSIGGTTNSRVTNNQIHHGGAAGMSSFQNTNLTVIGNHVYNNNTANTDPDFEAGGMKLVQDNGLQVLNNEVDHNTGSGIWIDILATNVLIKGNNVHDQAFNPIFYEVSSNAEIAENTITKAVGSRVWGCIVVSSSAFVNVHDNTCIDSTYVRAQLEDRSDLPPNAGTNIRLANNKLLRPTPTLATSWWQWSSTGPLVPGQNGNVDTGNQIVSSLTPIPTSTPTTVPTTTPTAIPATPTPLPTTCEVKVRLNGVEGPWKSCQ